MKAYKEYFNEETKKFDYIEYDVKSEFDFDHEPETNFYDALNGHNCHKESQINGIEKLNAKLESGEIRVLKCKDCGIYFILPQEEAAWFEDRGMALPKRCIGCRNKRKSGK